MDAELFSACFRAYGYSIDDLDAGFRRRLMAYVLLNPYWGLDVVLELGDPERRCATLEELERAVFAFGPD